MKRSQTRILAVVTCLALAWCAGVQAQSPPPEQATVTVKFAGGTMAEYVAELRGQVPAANIVLVTPETGSVALPPIELTNVPLDSAVHVIEGEFLKGGKDSRLLITVDRLGQKDTGGTIVYRVAAHRRGGPVSSDVHVWSVAGLLAQGVKSEDVLTAVETAVGLLEGHYSPAEVRFHEATGLLIARGQGQQLDAIENVVDGLMNSAHERREAAQEQKATQRAEQLELQLAARTAEARSLQQDQQTIARTRDALQRENQMLRDEISQLKSVVQDLQTRQ